LWAPNIERPLQKILRENYSNATLGRKIRRKRAPKKLNTHEKGSRGPIGGPPRVKETPNGKEPIRAPNFPRETKCEKNPLCGKKGGGPRRNGLPKNGKAIWEAPVIGRPLKAPKKTSFGKNWNAERELTH